MQYLREMPSGNRVPVSFETFMVDEQDKHYMQIVATSGLLIYRLSKVTNAPAPKPLKWGGRGQAGMVWNGA